MDRVNLERAIGELVHEYETLHACEVSSMWVEHYMGREPNIEITVTTRERVKVA